MSVRCDAASAGEWLDGTGVRRERREVVCAVVESLRASEGIQVSVGCSVPASQQHDSVGVWELSVWDSGLVVCFRDTPRSHALTVNR